MRWGVQGWFRCVLVPILVCPKPVLPLPLSSLRQSGLFPKLLIRLSCCRFKINSENCVTAKSEIGSENCIVADSEFDSENYVATYSKIGSKNCMTASLLIQKSAAKIVSLPIQKSAAKLCRCRFRNWQQQLHSCRFKNRQPKTVPLPIQKSATMVESFRLYFSFSFFFGCLQSIMTEFNI